MNGRAWLIAVTLIVLALSSSVLSAAWAQPAPTGAAQGGQVLPPDGPPDEPPGTTGETPKAPDQPGGGGAGAGTLPGARPGVGDGGTPSADAPDDNQGFESSELPADIRKQLEAIMPKGEPSTNGKLSMAFSKTEIEDFLQFLSSESGYTILAPSELSGQITIVSRVDVTLDDAFSILEAWLRLRNFSAVKDETRRIMTIVPLSKIKVKPIAIHGPDTPIDLADPNDIITQIVQLRYVDASKVAELITPLVDSEWAQITPSADLNAIIITDTAANIERLMQIMHELDRESETVTIKVIPLAYAPAKETAELIDQLVGTASPLPEEMLQRMGIDPASLQPGAQGYIGNAQRVKITADERTNSLIVLASEARIKQVEDILKDLDKDTNPQVTYRWFALESADATAVATMLNQIFEQPQGGPNGQSRGTSFMDMFNPFGSRTQQTTGSLSGLKENIVVADVRTNSVLVTASEANMKAYEDMIKSLDSSKPLSNLVHTYKINNATAADLQTVLQSAFQGSQRRQGGGFLDMIFGGMGGSSRSGSTSGPLDTLRQITVTADEKSNTLIVSGPPQAFDTVDKIIADLDRPQKQVYISVIIADVTLNDALRYGVEWDWFTRSNPSFTGSSDFGLSSWDQGIRWGVIGDQLQGFLEALDQKTKVRVISTPSILTLDNVAGTISSGRQITVKTGQRESTGGSITDVTDRVTAAITLVVTPHVNQDSCRLSIDQTVDDIGSADSYGNPEIIKRQAKADVLVGSGETIVLGGIIQEDVRETRRDVPVLSELPLIGQLFKSHETTVRRSELMVFITPYIVDGNADTRRVRQAIEEDLKQRFPGTDIDAVQPSGLRTGAGALAVSPTGQEPAPGNAHTEDTSGSATLPITRGHGDRH
jgi:general secretion pathway protein D